MNNETKITRLKKPLLTMGDEDRKEAVKTILINWEGVRIQDYRIAASILGIENEEDLLEIIEACEKEKEK